MPEGVGYRRVQFGGKVHVFPGDWSDEQVSTALATVPRETPAAPAAPAAAPMDPGMAQAEAVGPGGDPRLAVTRTIDPRAAALAGATPLMAASAIPGAGAARAVLPFARAAAPAARVVGGVAKDMAISQGVEELAKASGIPGASMVAELMLGGKAIKTGAKALLEKSFAKWAAEKAAAGGARAAAPIVATAAKVAKEGVTPSTVAAVARQVGREVKPDYKAVMAFVKNIGTAAKKREKIWMLLDDAGKPIRRLTADQAGAAARAGKATTFFSNLWGS